jgi:anaerobic dimethyl sulfoxide reductase subunit B (iron-sulfur subunit)
MNQLGFHFDQRYCIACRACQVACQDLKDLSAGTAYLRVETREEGAYPNPRVCHVLHGCWHCEAPPCVAVCESDALTKRAEDGIVVIDENVCVHCGLCAPACPYGAIVDTPRGGRKCDFCLDLLNAGREPACVEACLMGVLTHGPLGELPGIAPEGRGLPPASQTRPSLRMVPHRDWQSPVASKE